MYNYRQQQQGNSGFNQQQKQPYQQQQQSYQQHTPFYDSSGQGHWSGGQGQNQGLTQGNFQKFTESPQMTNNMRTPWQGQPHSGIKGQGHTVTKPDRSDQETDRIIQQLRTIFPDPKHEDVLRKVLSNHSSERDVEKLSNYCINVLY